MKSQILISQERAIERIKLAIVDIQLMRTSFKDGGHDLESEVQKTLSKIESDLQEQLTKITSDPIRWAYNALPE